MGGMTAFVWFWAMLVAVVQAVAGLVWLVRTLPRLAGGPNSAGAARAELDLRCTSGALAGEAPPRRRVDLGAAWA